MHRTRSATNDARAYLSENRYRRNEKMAHSQYQLGSENKTGNLWAQPVGKPSHVDKLSYHTYLIIFSVLS